MVAERQNSDLRFHACFASTPGLKRDLNEDAMLAQFPVFVVADGMGGHSAGEVASGLVVEGLQPLVGRSDLTNVEVADALANVQRDVTALSDTLPGGAGSTLTGVVATRSAQGNLEWFVTNIGDSRTYRVLGDRIVRATVDHSLVQELIDDGSITPEEASRHPEKNVITKAFGDGESLPDMWVTPIAAGERILALSDGALEGVSDEDLLRLLQEFPNSAEAARTIVELALANGGSDNISVVLVDVEGETPTTTLPTLTPFPTLGGGPRADQGAPPDDKTIPAASRRKP